MKKLIFMLAAAALISSCESERRELELGDAMPEFVLNDTLSSAQLKGKYALVALFASWCPSCQAELPHIDSMYAKYKDGALLNVLPVAREQTAEDVAELWQEKEFSMPVYPDPKREIYAKFAEVSIPRVYLFSPDGTLIFKSIGYAPEEAAALKKLLKEKLENDAQ
jgi:thiol-disulfide isomerase/thioredoxin